MIVQPTELFELVVIEEKDALATFTTPGALAPILAKVRERIDAFTGDASTDEGRAKIKKMAFAVTKSKTALESIGDRLAKDAKELPKKIDAGRKYVKDTLDAWRDEVRKPVDDWEQADTDRKNQHLGELEALKLWGANPPGEVESIKSTIATAEAVSDGADREEFADGFRLAKIQTLKALHEKLAWKVQYDAEQASVRRSNVEKKTWRISGRSTTPPLPYSSPMG